MKTRTKIILGFCILFGILYITRIDLRLMYYYELESKRFYSENERIKCQDFKGEKNQGNSTGILYQIGFGCVYITPPMFKCDCVSFFVPEGSWINCDLGARTQSNLDYQRIIFKESEYLARKLESEIRDRHAQGEYVSYSEYLDLYELYLAEQFYFKSELAEDSLFHSSTERFVFWNNKMDEKLKNYR
jgi:hypothetical protein